MDNIVTLKCGHCMVDVEPVLSESGPHIKAECPRCAGYIKFISSSELPEQGNLKLLIWNMTQGDLRLINSCKTLCGFKIGDYIDYWNLYRKVKLVITNAGIES